VTENLEALAIPGDKPVRVWVQDETRYGLISTVRRCWSLRGIRPRADYQTNYQWGYVFGALEITQGEGQFLFTGGVSLEWSRAFLNELVACAPEAIHVVLWDQAGFHLKAGVHEIPEQIRLLPLPPYSPELNPVEQVWNPLKRTTANKAWPSLEAIEETIAATLEPFWLLPQRVKQLLGDTWLTRGVDQFLKNRSDTD
jgi:transposase